MKKVLNFLEKYGLLVIFGLIIVQTCVSSNNKKQSEKKTLSQLDSIKIELKNLKESIKKEIKIEGLNTEKRILINTNQIFLTKERPDNRFLKIDEEIQQLEK